MLLPPLLALLSAASSLASPLSKRDPTSPTVTIKNGTLVGRYEALLQQELFLNTPYARPPIGDLRLANPLYYNISWSSPRSAKSWGNVCPGSGISSQNNASLGQDYNLNEDCLNINIIRPEGAKEGDELPFGGGFIQGTANDPRYNGSYLVQRSVELGEPIIFASINYRLTGFGFPAGQPAADAGVLNLGLKDQRLALHWVQENIAAFGGSPGKVTIWGQSAGGMSVTQQMLAYGGRDDGLFRAAIINSGIFAAQNRSVASQEKAWQSFLNSTSCTDVSTSLSCLRALPYETYYSALVNSSYNPAPIPDGDFITQSAVNAIKEGKIVNKNVLISATRDEATSGIGAPVGLQNETAFRSAVTSYFGTVLSSTNSTSQLNKISELYPDDPEVGCPFNTGDGVASSGLMDKRINALITDQLHAGSRYFAQLHSSLASTWSSRFHQVPQNQSIELGVSHANELPYIFGVLNRTIRTPLGTRKADEETSKLYQTYILNFVNHENPNGASDGSPNELYWPRYDVGQENLIFQNGKTRVEKDDYRKEGQEYLIELATGQT